MLGRRPLHYFLLLFAAALGIVLSISGVTLSQGSAASNGFYPVEHTSSPMSSSEAELLFLETMATFSNASAAAGIFPPDERQRMRDANLPFIKTIALVVIYTGNQYAGHCTGFFATPVVMVTAAHCLFSNGRFFDRVVAVPAYNGETYPPFGMASSWKMVVPRGWAEGRGALVPNPSIPDEFDWGIVVFDSPPWGQALEPFPYLADAPDSFFARPDVELFTAGYPGDKPVGMWWTSSREFVVTPTMLYTRMDMWFGQSGSPIYAISNDIGFIFSLVSSGDDNWNFSVRFTRPMLSALETYCRPFGCVLLTFTVPEGAGLGPSPTPTPTPTMTPTPTRTVPPTPTPTPTATPTQRPGTTPTPRPSPAPIWIPQLARD